MTTSISSEAQKSWMGIMKEDALKSRIDLLDKINTKTCFILYDDDCQSKLHKRWS